jgi:hypothetical protein
MRRVQLLREGVKNWVYLLNSLSPTAFIGKSPYVPSKPRPQGARGFAKKTALFKEVSLIRDSSKLVPKKSGIY